MLGAELFPGPLATGPWLNGSDISPWPCDADATALATMSAWSPWAQPYNDEIARLQQQVQDLKLWKHQAEESMRAYHQASLEGWSSSGYPWELQQSQFDVVADEVVGDSVHIPAASPRTGERRKVSNATPLSSLEPIRVPLGPEPKPLPRPIGSPAAAQETAAKVSESPMQLPPGLVLPPGLTLARAASLSGGAGEEATEPAVSLQGSAVEGSKAANSLPSSAAQGTVATSDAPPGMWIGPVQVAGTASMRAEWRIEDLRNRLQACMGRPLVSPPFAVCGLPNLRLMVFPDAREAVKSARSRERKGMYAAMVKKGPLHGALKLKADCLPLPTVLRFHLTVGAARKGPFTYDFSEQAIHGCDDFSVDWLRAVDDGTDNLRVGVEILEIRENRGLNSSAREGPSPAELYSLALQPLQLGQKVEASVGLRGSWP